MTESYEAMDWEDPGYGELHDELPLWSSPFGLALLERIPLRPQDTILEIGPGTGYLSIELAQRCGPQSRVIAVDLWAEGLRRLRWKLDRMGIANVEVIEADAASADIEPASVDLVVSNLGINNFEDPSAVLRAVHRASRDGADLFLATNTVGHMAEVYDVFRRTLHDLGQEGRLEALERHIEHRGTVDSLTRLLESTGFAVEHVWEKSFAMRFASGSAMMRHSLIRPGFAPAWKKIPEPGRTAETIAHLEERLNRAAAAQGELALTIPVVVVQARKSR